MKGARSKRLRLSIIGVFAAATIAVGIGQQINTTQAASVTPATAVNWNTYNDTGYPGSSGISLRYPPEWKINIPGVKVVGNTQNPSVAISERVIYLPASETPQEEWDTCGINVSADACGATPGDKTVSGSASTINGLAAYTATMQNSSGGTYHVTVIRGNKVTSDGAPFAEFITTANAPAALDSFAGVMASATSPN